MKPKTLYLDMDNVAWNFTEAFVHGANLTLNKNVDWREVKRYDFLDQFPELTKLRKISLLDSNLVFNEIRYIDDFKEIINEISRYTTVVFVSVCGIDTVKRKYKKVQDDFPNCTFLPILIHKGQYPTKKWINMSEGIFIDDVSRNLNESNADTKICFNYQGLEGLNWNSDWNGITWTRWRKHIEGYQLKQMLGVEVDEKSI